VRTWVHLIKLSGWMLAVCIVTSLLVASVNVLVLKATTEAMQTQRSAGNTRLWFALLCGILLVSRSAAEISLTRMMLDSACQLRVRLSRQIAAMSQKALEAVGSAAVLSAMLDDITMISSLGAVLPALTTNVFLAVGVLGYLYVVCPPVFALVAICIAIAVTTYIGFTHSATHLFANARDAQQEVLARANTLVVASKELRLDSSKHERVLTDLYMYAERSNRDGFHALTRYSLASGCSYAAYFFVIAILLTIPQSGLYGVSRSSATAAVLGVLFMRGAIETIVGVIPTVRKASVAMEHLHQIGLQVQAGDERHHHASSRLTDSFEYIRLTDVTYRYETVDRNTTFQLGPVSLDVRRGEILFLAGGNGVGKTSLLKVLCGLYSPTQGAIHLDRMALNDKLMPEYRQLFSAVFQDFTLLRCLPVLGQPDVAERARDYLHEFHLAEKVKIGRDEFICGELSRGQQKRLALIVALVEEKPICILDEWAADQDPQFRRYFYEVIVPRAKRQGRTIVAVTHDETYYHIADRLIRLNEGMLSVGT
jgi:putative pyoverdin transport system ATP-binding/permease protein